METVWFSSSFYYFMRMAVYSACLSVPYPNLVCTGRKVSDPLDLEFSEMLSGCWISNMHPLKEQLLTAEPSLQPHLGFLHEKILRAQ